MTKKILTFFSLRYLNVKLKKGKMALMPTTTFNYGKVGKQRGQRAPPASCGQMKLLCDGSCKTYKVPFSVTGWTECRLAAFLHYVPSMMHPSILNTCFFMHSGMPGSAEAFPSYHREARRQCDTMDESTVHQNIEGKTNNHSILHTHTSDDQFRVSSSAHMNVLDCGRLQENLERTQTETGDHGKGLEATTFSCHHDALKW